MQCEYLLIEADGSRGLPVKAPAGHEPVLTAGTELVIAILGLTGIGRPISAVCHRPERVCALLGVSPDAAVTPERAAALILSRDGLRKHTDGRRCRPAQSGGRGEGTGGRAAHCLPATTRNCLCDDIVSGGGGMKVLIRGAGDLASGIAYRLHQCELCRS